MTPQKHEHCRGTDGQEGDGQQHCPDHSGLLAWMKGIAALLTASACMLGYSVIWQAPDIRLDVAKEIARLDKKDQARGFEIDSIRKDVAEIGRRVSCLEEK